MTGCLSEKIILDGLNERQKEAVLHKNGPLLILAGAGSGKTKVVSHRIANLIHSGIDPVNILAITFTNKAAEEMQKRISAMAQKVSAAKNMPTVSTFHALGARILRECEEQTGIPKNFSILDEEDSLALIKECGKKLSLDPKQWPPAKMRAVISNYKNELYSASSLAESAPDSPFLKIIAKLWEEYDRGLKDNGALDFDDLILKPLELWRAHPVLLKRYQDLWRHIHIDEYQDTNHVQYALANLLAKNSRNICAVGDVDQSIYGWRGADFRNILNFETDWPDTKIITLEENYRSTQNILNAANAVIVKNKLRKPKNLFTQKGSGAKIQFFLAGNELEEAAFMAAKAKMLLNEASFNAPPKIAVLYRTNFQSRVIEEEFIKNEIPYELVGVKFYERKEVKDILSYVKAALNGRDSLSLKRVLNIPARGIGKVLALKYLSGAPLDSKEKDRISKFEKILDDIKNVADQKNASATTRFVLEKSGYENMLCDGTEEGAMRLANIQELVSLAQKYDKLNPPQGLEQLLADAALMSEQDSIKQNAANAVRLMTVHAAKGLEFDAVFVAGLEDGLFPHIKIFSSGTERDGEEERRLFYVALTRAKKNLFLSYAVFRTIFGSKQVNKPSRFLSDIPEYLLESVINENPSQKDLKTIFLD